MKGPKKVSKYGIEAHRGHQVTNRIKVMARADAAQMEQLCRSKGRQVVEMFDIAPEIEAKIK